MGLSASAGRLFGISLTVCANQCLGCDQPMLGLPPTNAWFVATQCLVRHYPMLGLPQPNAWFVVAVGLIHLWGTPELLLPLAVMRFAHRLNPAPSLAFCRMAYTLMRESPWVVAKAPIGHPIPLSSPWGSEKLPMVRHKTPHGSQQKGWTLHD